MTVLGSTQMLHVHGQVTSGLRTIYCHGAYDNGTTFATSADVFVSSKISINTLNA